MTLDECCVYAGVKLGGGSHRISDPAPLVRNPLPLITDHVPHNWDPPLCTVCRWRIFLSVMFCKKMCGHSVILHLSTLGVDRCCKRQTLFKCRKSQTECLECSKTPCRESHLCSWPFELELRPFKHQRIHRLLLSNLTTGNLR